MINVRPVLRFALVMVLLAGVSVASSTTAGAHHSWGSYHWARQSNPFTLTLADNVTSQWDSHLDVSVVDWNKSTVLQTRKAAGTQNPKNCRPTAGRVEVCNAKYGANGWLGIAQIWASGSHITQGTVKLNDTYFNTAAYNNPAWRNVVMCQEIGHTFGLGHQDEDFNTSLGSCMDYSNDAVANQHPNQHDYDELVRIYSHLDPNTTVKSSSATSAAGNAQDDWGRSVGRGHKTADGHFHNDVFVKDLGNGNVVVTHVLWAAHSH